MTAVASQDVTWLRHEFICDVHGPREIFFRSEKGTGLIEAWGEVEDDCAPCNDALERYADWLNENMAEQLDGARWEFADADD